MKNISEIVKIMTPFPHTIELSSDLETAREMLTEHDISHLPVTKDGELAGILTKRDIDLGVKFNQRLAAGQQLAVADLCQLDVLVVDSSEIITNVLARMLDRHSESVLIAKKNRLVGIVSFSDLYRLLHRTLVGAGEDEPPDISA